MALKEVYWMPMVKRHNSATAKGKSGGVIGVAQSDHCSIGVLR
ncbi:hypothetical protein V8J82_12935 [Gymnodinialimonas sp. 2305UL16-5]